jgi:hypothetical protein
MAFDFEALPSYGPKGFSLPSHKPGLFEPSPKNQTGLRALTQCKGSTRERSSVVNVSIKLDNIPMQTYAVYIDDIRVARGLPKAEASRIQTQVLSREAGAPRKR